MGYVMSYSTKTNSRRSFLGKALWLVPVTGLAGCDVSGSGHQSADAKIVAHPRATSDYVATFLTKSEWSFVTAMTDRLIPADAEGPGAMDAGVPEFIDRQMATPYAHGGLWYMQGPFVNAEPEFGYQLKLVPREIVRLGIAGADAACQQQHKKLFADLNHAQQESFISALEMGAVALGDVPSRLFFSFMLQITREGFFSDPIHGGNRAMVGWKLIGFPGARADFMDFVNQNGARYPLPSVSIEDANPKI